MPRFVVVLLMTAFRLSGYPVGAYKPVDHPLAWTDCGRGRTDLLLVLVVILWQLLRSGCDGAIYREVGKTALIASSCGHIAHGPGHSRCPLQPV